MSQLNDILTQIQKGRIEEAHLFSNFEKYYQIKDKVKASEFLWGSIGKIGFLIGLLYGQKLGAHKNLIAFLRNLGREQDQKEILEAISAAESLHSNFYHNWMSDENFEELSRKVIRLRILLLEILEKKLEETYRTTNVE